MCRWLAYTGAPVLLSRVLYTPVRSMIDLSLRSRLGAEASYGVVSKGDEQLLPFVPKHPGRDEVHQ